MKAGPTGTITLPHWLQISYVAVAEAPWTNVKTLNAILLTNATALFLGIAAVFKIEVNIEALWAWLTFVAAISGVAMLGAGIKRATYKPAPPNGPDYEDAQAGATGEMRSPNARTRGGDKTRRIESEDAPPVIIPVPTRGERLEPDG